MMKRAATACLEQTLVPLPYFDSVLAQVEADADRPREALKILDDAISTSERIHRHIHDSELHRLRGEILLQFDPLSAVEAEKAFTMALAVARAQHTRTFELRAALSLARLHCQSGRADQACSLISEAMDGLSDTEFPEYQAAKGLLVHSRSEASKSEHLVD